MDRHQERRRAFENAPSAPHDRDCPSRDRGRAGGSERHEQPRANNLDLLLEPPLARLDLTRVGLLVKTSLAPRFVLEVLYCIRQVELAAIDAGACEGLVEEAPGRPDERPPADILLVAGLLADEHDGSIARPLPENRLRGLAIERTALAALRLAREVAERPLRRRDVKLDRWRQGPPLANQCTSLAPSSAPRRRIMARLSDGVCETSRPRASRVAPPSASRRTST
jgi:hypothetical protein